MSFHFKPRYLTAEEQASIAAAVRAAERKAHNRPRNVKARGYRRHLMPEVNKGRDGLWYPHVYRAGGNILVLAPSQAFKTRKGAWEYLSAWVDAQ